MKAAIVIVWPSRNRPGNYGQYKWNQNLECYVWTPDARFPTGRIFNLPSELKEFHACADKELSRGIQFPNPTIRFIAGETSGDLSTVPIEELVAVYKSRNKEARKFQLAQAREEKQKSTRRHRAVLA